MQSLAVRISIAAVAVVLAVLLFSGCESNAAEPAVDERAAMIGRWELQSVDGQPLPFWYRSDFCQSEIQWGELRFGRSVYGDRMLTTSRHRSWPDGAGHCLGPEWRTYRDEFDRTGWSIHNGALTVRLFFPVAPMRELHGQVSGDVITLQHVRGFRHPDGVWIYRKISNDPIP